MSKHTPGPWEVGNQDPLNFGQQQGNGTQPIGFVYGPSFPERSELGQRAIADARLIAAAPELLAALIALDEAFCTVNEYSTKEERHSARLALIATRAAIAKATGEQP